MEYAQEDAHLFGEPQQQTKKAAITLPGLFYFAAFVAYCFLLVWGATRGH